MTDRFVDPRYLRDEQYRNAANLNARIQLHARFGTNKYPWHRWVFDQFDLPAESRVLELGCGPGHLWKNNIDRIPPGWTVTLSDFSPGMLQEARDNLGDGEHPFTFEQIDAQSIPMKDGSLDAVIANHMLYHVPDRKKACAEIRRTLKPAGRFYAATNGQCHMKEIHEWKGKAADKPAEDFAPPKTSFRLENGSEELSRFFDSVELLRYEEHLEVTEVQPLVAYVESMKHLDEEQLQKLWKMIEEEIRLRGALHITKSQGLFICS